jgi:hypothetical protein
VPFDGFPELDKAHDFIKLSKAVHKNGQKELI